MSEPTASEFWQTHCGDCAHDLHPMDVCSAIVGGDSNGPDYCPCTLDYQALASAYKRLRAHTLDLDSPAGMSEPLRVVWDEAVRRHGDPHAYRPDLCRCGTFNCEVRAAILTPTLDLDSPEMVERLARALDSLDGQSAGYWDRRRDPAVLLTNAGLAVAILAALREGTA